MPHRPHPHYRDDAERQSALRFHDTEHRRWGFRRRRRADCGWCDTEYEFELAARYNRLRRARPAR